MQEDTRKPRIDRIQMSLQGVLPALLGMPFVMRLWAPWSEAIVWTVLYGLVSICGWILVYRGVPWVESFWSTTVGILFGWQPISAYFHDPGSNSVWIAVTVCVLAISFEVSTLPYLPVFEWRTGAAVISGVITGVSFVESGPVGLAMALVLLALISNGSNLRASKEELERAYATVESSSQRAHMLAHRDEMTGLLNRRGLLAEMERIDERGDLTTLMVDADRFKTINDTHGHGAGDDVLRRIAEVLRERLGPSWSLARLGGDEFVAVATSGDELVSDICEPVECSVTPYGVESRFKVALSGGVVTTAGDVAHDALLSRAGYAMRVAKRGGGGLATFDEELAERFEHMVELSSSDLDPASFVALYQPIVDANGVTVGCEALCRWRRTDGTVLTPDRFLPLVAESGQMGLLNETMLRKGLSFAARFNDLADPPFVSINIASTHLGDARLLPIVTELLTEFNVDPRRLMIELTENDMLDQETAWHQTATRLLHLGIKLAIDDYGSGYSNIERLNTLPISHLKFDRSFTTALSGPLRSVARGVVEFAAESNIGVIAEGIETQTELEEIKTIGVEEFQGYLFSRPIEPDALEERIRSELFPHTIPVEYASQVVVDESPA